MENEISKNDAIKQIAAKMLPYVIQAGYGKNSSWPEQLADDALKIAERFYTMCDTVYKD